MREMIEELEGSQLTEESTGRYVMEKLISMADVRKIKKNSDEQTGQLAMEVYVELIERIDKALGREGREAINRLMNRTNFSGKDTSGIIRNNIFKAANTLKMKLPSMMF